MKRIWKLLLVICVLTACMASNAFVAGWKTGQGENSSRWWYDLENGQYYGNLAMEVEWQWLDGNGDGIAECYAFDREGWMYTDTITPDGYRVNKDGAWTVDGGVQTMAVAAGFAGTRAQASQTNTNGNKILIAYFSHTGTTEEAAKEIQAVVGGDLFEITVTNPYPSSYQSTVDQARRELDQNARPGLSSGTYGRLSCNSVRLPHLACVPQFDTIHPSMSLGAFFNDRNFDVYQENTHRHKKHRNNENDTKH